MRKKIIAIVLLSICVLLLSAAAFAEEPQRHFHSKDSFDMPISDLSQLQEDCPDGVYLTADLTAASDLTITKEIKLCLNGHKLDMGEYSILIADSAKLTVNDCPESTGAGICSTAVSDKAIIQNDGIFELVSGTINTSNRSALMNMNICDIYGGLITGTASELVQTTGSAMFSMGGGEIHALGSASGLCMVESAQDASAKKRDYNAGVSFCSISAQKGSEGAVLVKAPAGRMVINSGADIQGFGCPGIKVLSGKFDAYGGAKVSSDSESAIVGTGGDVSLYFSTINSVEKYGVDIGGDCKLLLSGSQDINGALAGIHLAEEKLFSMSDYGFYGDVRVSLYIDKAPESGGSVPVSTACEQKHSSHFLSANPQCSIKYMDGAIHCVYDESVSHFHDRQNYVLALNGSYSDLNRNNYYLADDIALNGLYIGKTVNICLNGHTIKLSAPIKLYPGATLNIHDCVGGGMIVSDSCCISSFDGASNLVLYSGVIQSNANSAIRLTHGSNVILRGGEIKSLNPEGKAIEVSGLGGSVKGTGGTISGESAGISVQNSLLSVEGEVKISGKNYGIEYPDINDGTLILDGSPIIEGGIADILLGAKTLLTLKDTFAPTENYSLSAQAADGNLSTASGKDHSAAFVSVEEGKAVFNGENNVLHLVSSLPMSPDEAVCYPGDSISFKISGASVDAEYQWYIRQDSGTSQQLESAGTSALNYTAEQTGEYLLYCNVSDSAGQYVSSARLSVKRDELTDIAVVQNGELLYNGQPLVPQLNATGSTLRGLPVSFSYSADNISFDTNVPTVGPESGEHIIYYRASAQDCEDVTGQVRVKIAEPENKLSEKDGRMKSSQKTVLLISAGILFALLAVYVLCISPKKKRQ